MEEADEKREVVIKKCRDLQKASISMREHARACASMRQHAPACASMS
jgi:hypothetical protein